MKGPVAHLRDQIDIAWRTGVEAGDDLPILLDAVARVGWDAHLRLQFDRARAMPDTVRTLYAEGAMLARQLQSITEHCDRARFGLVRTSEIYRLIITDPADEETPR